MTWPPHLLDLAELAALHHHATLEEVLSSDRHRRVCRARAAVLWALRYQATTELSYADISILTGFDPGLVRRAAAAHEARLRAAEAPWLVRCALPIGAGELRSCAQP